MVEIFALVGAALAAGVVAGTQTGVSEGVVEWFRRRRQQALPGPGSAPAPSESASEPDLGPSDGTGGASVELGVATPDEGTTYHTRISDCINVSVGNGTQINHRRRSRRER
ncbi:hypothetical protein ABZX82_28810 [Streptomyces griseoflavus]|uniref:hypothetical protein n=1 Tax=Streptomyces griseoflavus TaxID=35619 RepID=UPI00167E3FE5|nr:hypothetical protein [Streptomyces griseoflavus]GGV43569.1 hypothetical protein GCM10010293_50250 [Streptomyces griseoflavus]